jgi:invasion protein IalB
MTPSSSLPTRYALASVGTAVTSPISGASGAYPFTAVRKSRHQPWSISCAASRRQPSALRVSQWRTTLSVPR